MSALSLRCMDWSFRLGWVRFGYISRVTHLCIIFQQICLIGNNQSKEKHQWKHTHTCLSHIFISFLDNDMQQLGKEPHLHDQVSKNAVSKSIIRDPTKFTDKSRWITIHFQNGRCTRPVPDNTTTIRVLIMGANRLQFVFEVFWKQMKQLKPFLSCECAV